MSARVRDRPMDPQTVIEQAENIVNQRREQAAARLGIDASLVHTHRIELHKMREAGLLVDIDIHGVSMFSISTTFAELGISDTDVRRERLRGGKKDLFPEYSRKLRSLETRARVNLAKHSYQIPAFGQYRWLPWTAYEKFIEQHNAILAELQAMKEQLLNDYDALYVENAVYFEQVARRAWKDLHAGFADGAGVIVTTDDIEFLSTQEEAFVKYIVQKVLGKMPMPEEISAFVRIDYKTSVLYSEAEIAADQASLEQAQAARAHAQLKHAQAAQAEFEISLQRQDAVRQAEARIAVYRQAELEHARQQLAEMGSPIQEALDGLRTNLYTAVAVLLRGLRSHGSFRGKASSKAASLYAYWKQLNGGLLQDDDLDQALSSLDAEMQAYQRANKDQRRTQIGDIVAQLTEIESLTAESARKLSHSADSRASALEL